MLYLLTSAIALLLSTPSWAQLCRSWRDQNPDRTAPTYNADDAGWVGGGVWKIDDFPQDPYPKTTRAPGDEQVTNQNFTWLVNPPQDYLYIDKNDPNAAKIFEDKWVKNLTMDEKLGQTQRVRPAGFKYAFIRAFNKKVPCITVGDTTDRGQIGGFGLEIAVYAQEDHQICIRDKKNAAEASVNNQADNAFQEICGQQRVKHCFVTSDASRRFEFEIFAKTSYELVNGFGVFYRMRKSRYSYKQSGNEARSASTEMWCMMLNGIDWPEFIGATPQNGLDIPRTGGAGVASLLIGSAITLVASLVM